MSATRKRPQPYQTLGVAILNAAGEIWTDEVFAEPEAAIQALKEHLGANFDPKNFSLVPATLTVTADEGQPAYPLTSYLEK